MEFPLTVESHVVHFSRKMSREELNMHSLTLIPDDTLTLVAKMVFVQVGFFGLTNMKLIVIYFFKILLQHLLASELILLNVFLQK